MDLDRVDEQDGGPYKALEYVCYWRQVPYLPWLKPLHGS